MMLKKCKFSFAKFIEEYLCAFFETEIITAFLMIFPERKKNHEKISGSCFLKFATSKIKDNVALFQHPCLEKQIFFPDKKDACKNNCRL